jgi:hypothetical protein
MGAMSVDNAAYADTDIARHRAKVHACAPPSSTTNVSHIICVGLCCRSKVGPQVIGGRIGNQIDPRAGLPADGVCDISQTLRCNSIGCIVSGPILGCVLDIQGFVSGAGILVPPSLMPAIEFTAGKLDTKISRGCWADFAANNGRKKRNNIAGKRCDFHGVSASLLWDFHTAFCHLPPADAKVNSRSHASTARIVASSGIVDAAPCHTTGSGFIETLSTSVNAESTA